MANPTDKLKVSINEEISPDGNPTGVIQAAPKSQHQVPPQEQKVEQPVVKEEPKVEEPKKEEQQVEEPEVNLEAFLNVKESADQQSARELKKAEEAAKLQTTPVQQQQQVKPGQRDYSDLSEEDKPLFERMSNEAFAKLKPVYLEHKKLKENLTAKDTEVTTLKKQLEESQKGVTKIPDSYYTHENAYVLTPEFSQAAAQANDAQVIYNHWKNELNNVRRGAKEISFLDRDPRTGQLIITKKIPADIDSESQLLEWVDYARDIVTKTSGQVQAIRQTYGNKYQDSVKTLQQQEQQYFNSMFDTEEKKKNYEPLVQKQLESLPATFRSNPLAAFVAKSLAMNVVLANYLSNLQQQQQGKQQQQQQVVTTKQPTAAEIAGEVGEVKNKGKKGEDVTFDDFDKVKGGY